MKTIYDLIDLALTCEGVTLEVNSGWFSVHYFNGNSVEFLEWEGNPYSFDGKPSLMSPFRPECVDKAYKALKEKIRSGRWRAQAEKEDVK